MPNGMWGLKEILASERPAKGASELWPEVFKAWSQRDRERQGYFREK